MVSNFRSDNTEKAVQMSCPEDGCSEKAGVPASLLNRILFGKNCAIIEAVPLARTDCPREDCGSTLMKVTTTHQETIVWLKGAADPAVIEEDLNLTALPTSHLDLVQPPTVDPSGDEDRHLSAVPALHPEPS